MGPARPHPSDMPSLALVGTFKPIWGIHCCEDYPRLPIFRVRVEGWSLDHQIGAAVGTKRRELSATHGLAGATQVSCRGEI